MIGWFYDVFMTKEIKTLILKTHNYATHVLWLPYPGMHLLWWFIWLVFLFWIFATPYDIPEQMKKKDAPLDILNRRLASGDITNEEYR